MPESKPQALIICFSELNRDPRVLRQIGWIRESFQITTLGISPSGVADVDHVTYTKPRHSSIIGKIKRAVKYFSRDYKAFYWSSDKNAALAALRTKEFNVIIANDVDTLPLALKLASQSTHVHFDAHEYAPLEFSDRLRWRILRQPLIEYICRTYISRVSSASTVCGEIANKYEAEFDKPFAIVTNASEYHELSPSITTSPKFRMIYHGLAHPSRRTDQMIEMMRFLDDRFELNLMLVGENAYLDQLRAIAASMLNVKFLPPVKTQDIVSFTNQFDIGVFLLPPTNFNYRYALPNKFFEFIQARLAMVISPSPEMARIVRERDLGLVAEDFSPESAAAAIKTLTAKRIDHYKAQAHKHARDLSAEKNGEIFRDLIARATK